mmetsp:Transcript_38629/g.70279  ORF Transcript_38629/g.70279 Transcript_38629/m.70279 type:complete len:213 (-) Transcript_38629:1026-1664(-)
MLNGAVCCFGLMGTMGCVPPTVWLIFWREATMVGPTRRNILLVISSRAAIIFSLRCSANPRSSSLPESVSAWAWSASISLLNACPFIFMHPLMNSFIVRVHVPSPSITWNSRCMSLACSSSCCMRHRTSLRVIASVKAARVSSPVCSASAISKIFSIVASSCRRAFSSRTRALASSCLVAANVCSTITPTTRLRRPYVVSTRKIRKKSAIAG